ncbi:MAG: replicative DNA helicase, partial [Clostridia bacterium]|nr:replicative DNA helicase [Clostridia bacterium]
MSQLERIPPHHDEAEKSVLGAILVDKEVFFRVSEVIGAEDFYTESHREIFRAMVDLYQRSEPIDVITVSDALKRRNTLEAVGGKSYIGFLSTIVPTTANAVQYAKIISEKASLRRLISASGEIVEQCYSEKLDSVKVLDHAERTILDIAKTKQTSEFSDIRQVLNLNLEAINEAAKNGGVIPGLSTHFKDLDRMLSGL